MMPFKILWRAVGFVVLIMLLSFLCAPAGALDARADLSVALFLQEAEGKDGIIELDLEILSDTGICAMLCELDYDPEAFVYLSGGACDENFSFSALDLGGTVRFLLDSANNSLSHGSLSRLYFKKIGGDGGGFSLKCLEAFYIHEGDIAQVVDVEILAPAADEKDEGRGDGEKQDIPQISGVEVEAGVVSFSVNVGGDCFAAGMRLYFVDLGGCGQHFEVVVAGVVGQDGVFRGRYSFCPDKSYAVVMTAQGYSGKRTVRGEKITLLYTRQD